MKPTQKRTTTKAVRRKRLEISRVLKSVRALRLIEGNAKARPAGMKTPPEKYEH